MSPLIRVLFVCMGNICRSPAAEGVMKHLIKERGVVNYYVESSGIGNWHVGNLPDERMVDAAKQRGIELDSRAKQFLLKDYDRFDYILAADHEVMSLLQKNRVSEQQGSKLYLMTHFSINYYGEEVPDPYYDKLRAFDTVLDMLEDSCRGFIEHIEKKRST